LTVPAVPRILGRDRFGRLEAGVPSNAAAVVNHETTTAVGLSSGPRVLIIGASLVIIIAGMRAAAPVLLPFALALFLAILSLPLLGWLRERRVPAPIAVVVTLLANAFVIAGLIFIVSRSLTDFINSLPRYVVLIQATIDNALARLAERGVDTTYWETAEFINPGALLDLARGTLRGVAGVLSMTVLVLIILIFILAEASGFGDKVRAAMGQADADLSRFTRITSEVQRFLGIKTLTSLATGTLIGIWTWLMGLDFPLLWGLLAFLLNYIPSIGSILAAIPAVGVALLQYGVSRAIVIAIGYLAVNITIGNLIEPNVMGRRLGLSALVVVLSLIFWGWVFGPIGMFLSVPLTVIVKIMLENTNDFRWVAVLLDSPRATTPPPREVHHESPLA
jgi:AI-2 transport protein TqsA